MPKKNSAQPIRPELVEPLTEILRDKGNDVRLWPKDEASAYRKAGGFQAGHDAVMKVRLAKAASAIEAVIGAAVLKSYVEGVSDAQSMTGFSDETFRSILDKEGLTDIDLGGDNL